jgi:hypothetical protein
MRDADILQIQLENTGRLISRLKRKGICLHLSRREPSGGPYVCLDCGKTWLDFATFENETTQLREEYL